MKKKLIIFVAMVSVILFSCGKSHRKQAKEDKARVDSFQRLLDTVIKYQYDRLLHPGRYEHDDKDDDQPIIIEN